MGIQKLRGWLLRYGVAEIFGTLGALLGAAWTGSLTHDGIWVAYGGALGENCGFYAVMLLRDILADRRRELQKGTYGAVGLWRTLCNLAVEFGPAELFDTGFSRPLAIGLGIHFMGQPGGVLLGKVLGDLIFYVPVVATYELRLWLRQRSAAVEASLSADSKRTK